MLRAIRDWFRWAWGEWDRFWFTPVNPSLLGIIRILAGGMIFYTHLIWTRGIEDFYGSTGWLRQDLMEQVQDGMVSPSFWWYVPDAWLYPVHYACLAILAAFMLGLATRMTSILTFVIVVSYAYRTMPANFGLDQINALAVMYLCIGPSGRCWSLDALIRKWRGTQSLPHSVTANISLRLMQLHLCIIYAFAGMAKLGGPAWWDGYAIWMAAANYEYQSWSLLWMADHPYLFNLISHVSIAWELTFWSLVWKPRLRPIVLAIGVGMHLGIGAFLGMWTFGLAMIIVYFSFIPPAWFDPRRTKQLTARTTTAVPRDDWQARLQAYIEEYVKTAPVTDENASTRVKEPMIVVAKPSKPIAGAAASMSSKALVANNSVGTDKAETAAIPRVLLLEPRVQRGLQLQESLLSEGYQCHVAVDSQHAAQSLAMRRYDALVVNVTSMSRSQWTEFAGLMGDHPGPELTVIAVLQSWQWDWQIELTSERVLAVRFPLPEREVVSAVTQST